MSVSLLWGIVGTCVSARKGIFIEIFISLLKRLIHATKPQWSTKGNFCLSEVEENIPQVTQNCDLSPYKTQ